MLHLHKPRKYARGCLHAAGYKSLLLRFIETWTLLISHALRQRVWWYFGLVQIILEFFHAIVQLIYTNDSTRATTKPNFLFMRRKQSSDILLIAFQTNVSSCRCTSDHSHCTEWNRRLAFSVFSQLDSIRIKMGDRISSQRPFKLMMLEERRRNHFSQEIHFSNFIFHKFSKPFLAFLAGGPKVNSMHCNTLFALKG